MPALQKLPQGQDFRQYERRKAATGAAAIKEEIVERFP